jgi:subtilisin family serine protease
MRSVPIIVIYFLCILVFVARLLPESVQASTKKGIEPFIIEFSEPSQSEAEKALPPNITRSKRQAASAAHRRQLHNQHDQFKARLQKTFGNKALVKQDYYYLLNGINLELPAQDIEALKRMPGIKQIQPDHKVTTLLSESAPLIGTNVVWPLTDLQFKNLTGQGITIGIIDTGIDYTHADLGASPISERPFDVIAAPASDNIIYNNNRLAYTVESATKTDLFIYSFTTNQSTKIDLFDANTSVALAALDGDHLAYFGFGPADGSSGLYYKNIKTGEQRHIVVTRFYSKLSIVNDKLIYSRGPVNCYNDCSNNRIYLYDIVTKTETPLTPETNIFTYTPLVSGTKIAYDTSTPTTSYDKLNVLDYVTGITETHTPPDLCRIEDFKGDHLLYRAFNPNNFDPLRRTYYRYNLKTKQASAISYPTQPQPDQHLQPQDYIIGVNLESAGYLLDNLTIFLENWDNNRIIVYNHSNQTYAKINLLTNSISFTAYGSDRICFIATNRNLYCHTYDPTFDYTEPSNVYNDKVIAGYNWVTSSSNAYDDHGHGTHVAATVAGNGVLKGVAPEAKLVSYKVLDSHGRGYQSNVIGALDFAGYAHAWPEDVGYRMDMVSLSLGTDCKYYYGGYTSECGPDDLVSKAVDRASERGLVVVVAAGNSGNNGASTITSPGTARTAITIGATNKTKQLTSFSSLGPVTWNGTTIIKPDLLAPGYAICAAEKYASPYSAYRCLDNTHIALSGTSMATPHVAGAAALILQLAPHYSPALIKQTLINSAQNLNLTPEQQGYGFIRVDAAVSNYIPGDHTADFDVDAEDFHLQQVTSFSTLRGDVNGNRKTDISDVNYIYKNFGRKSSISN